MSKNDIKVALIGRLENSPSVLVENEMPPLSELKGQTGNGKAEAQLKSPQKKQFSS